MHQTPDNHEATKHSWPQPGQRTGSDRKKPMRKMIITGVTSGIGKALVEKYDGNYIAKYKEIINVEGHSRKYNKHDIDNIKEWFNPEADIFINNAYNDFKWWAQTQALLFVFHLWKDDPNKHIVSVSSIALGIVDTPQVKYLLIKLI